MSLNDIFDALLVIGVSIEPGASGSQWGEYGRKMKDPTKAQLPALWQIEGDSQDQSRVGQMQRREEQITWVVCHGAGKDQGIEPARYSQDLKDKIRDKFGDKGIAIQSLGGLVFAAFIKGAIRRFPGDLDGLEMITVPITIILP